MNQRNDRIFKMPFARVYPLYVVKAQRKGRTKAEVDEIIKWLTGYKNKDIEKIVEEQIDFESFFVNAPKLNPARKSITGIICGVRVEVIEDPLMQEIRYLDKVIDELAKGWKLEKIFRE